MAIDTLSRRAFSDELQGFQLAWDATSLNAFQRCPRYYQYTILEGWTTQKMRLELQFGILIHRCFEVLDRAAIRGMDPEDGLRAAVLLAMREGKVLDTYTEDNTRTRACLVRILVWYEKFYRKAEIEHISLADGREPVELAFNFSTGQEAGTGESLSLCGYLDRVAKIDDELVVIDHKTTKGALGSGYFDRYSPDTQMTVYALAGQVIFGESARIGVLVDAIQLQVGGVKFARATTRRNKRTMAEALRNYTNSMRLAEMYARQEYWPQNDATCSLYGNCVFRGACSMNPEHRHRYLASNFKKQEKGWDPLIPR